MAGLSLSSVRTAPMAAAGAALLVRAAGIVALHGTPLTRVMVGDAMEYQATAARIAAGEFGGIGPFFQSAPFYPFLLAAVSLFLGGGWLPVAILQSVVGAAACAAMARTAERVFPGRPAAGWAAGLGAAVYGPLVFHDLEMLPASLASSLLAFGILRSVTGSSRRAALAGGALLGAAVAFSPGLLLIAVAGGALLFRLDAGSTLRARLVRPAALLVGVGLVVSPILVWNLATGGGAFLASSAGVNAFIGNNPRANGAFFLPPGSGLDGTDLEGTSRREAERAAGRSLSAAEVSAHWRGRALAYVAAEPVAWLRLMGRKALLAVNHYEIPNHLSSDFLADRFLPLLHWTLPFGIVFPLAGLGAALALGLGRPRPGSDAGRPRPRRRGGDGEGSAAEPSPPPGSAAWVIGSAALALLVPVLFFATGRYRLPAAPPLLVLAGGGVAWLAVQIRGRAWARAAAGLGVVAIFAAPVPLRLVREGDYSFDHLVLGTVERRLGDLDAAVREFKLAEETGPARLDAAFRLAQALAERGNAAEAQAALRRHVARHPDDAEAAAALAAFPPSPPAGPPAPRTDFEIGTERLLAGDLAAASAALERAIRADPVHARALANLAAVRDREGNRAEAVRLLERASALQPAAPDLLRSLAVALYKDGRRSEAREAAERASRLSPEDPETRALLERLR